MSKTIQDRAIVTLKRQSKLICGLSNGAISNDLDCALHAIS